MVGGIAAEEPDGGICIQAPGRAARSHGRILRAVGRRAEAKHLRNLQPARDERKHNDPNPDKKRYFIECDLRKLAEIDGMLRVARRDRAGGLAALARAASLEAARPRPVARPYPIKPAGELYGEALASEGDPAAAARQFQAALSRTPNRAASLIGLARAQRAAGQQAEAVGTARKFVAIWHAADAGRPEIVEARRIAGVPTGRVPHQPRKHEITKSVQR